MFGVTQHGWCGWGSNPDRQRRLPPQAAARNGEVEGGCSVTLRHARPTEQEAPLSSQRRPVASTVDSGFDQRQVWGGLTVPDLGWSRGSMPHKGLMGQDDIHSWPLKP